MIVQPRASQLLLIRQMDHASLSGMLAAHWGNSTFARPEPRASVLLAAAQHDDGWEPWEAQPKVNPATRRPYRFTEMPVEEHLSFYLQGIDRVLQKDLYAGLLVNMHLAGLYRHRYGLDPILGLERFSPEVRLVVQKFLDRLETQQGRLREQLRREGTYPAATVADAGIWTNYRLLQAFDLLSLFLCMEPLGPRVLRQVPVDVAGAKSRSPCTQSIPRP